MSRRNFTLEGIVLKRSKVGETDRLVTLLTREQGKLVCVAKGVRKLNSSKRAMLEPGNHVRAYFVRTKSLPLLTQAKLIEEARVRADLAAHRQLSQILEIFERLFVEEEVPDVTYDLALNIRQLVLHPEGANREVRTRLAELISQLGFQDPALSPHASIQEYVQNLTDRRLNSFAFLGVE